MPSKFPWTPRVFARGVTTLTLTNATVIDLGPIDLGSTYTVAVNMLSTTSTWCMTWVDDQGFIGTPYCGLDFGTPGRLLLRVSNNTESGTNVFHWTVLAC